MSAFEDFPPSILNSPFTVAQAQDLGLSYARLHRQDIVSISRGIKATHGQDDAALSLALLTRPYTQVTGYSAASHATAFILWELPGFLPEAMSGTIHISRQYPHSIPRRSGIQGHRTMFDTDEVQLVDGLWLTSRARTWLDCARSMSVEELVVTADHLIRIPRPAFERRNEEYVTLEELSELLSRHPGTPGIVKARAALELARVGSDSPQETKLRLACSAAGLPEPHLNEPTLLANGVIRQPDQSYPDYKVAVEYDGNTHADPRQVEKDVRRAEDYANAGWSEVRIMRHHMQNDAKEAVRKVREALWAHGWRPSSDL